MTSFTLALPLLVFAGCGHAPPVAENPPDWPVELKLELGETAAATLSLEDDDADTREVWFYDTPTRSLEAAGLTLRARKVHGAPDDSTVKIRPIPPGTDQPWRDLDGFKCEVDRAGETSETACSLTTEQERGEIGRAGRGKRRVQKLFSREQEAFAEQRTAVPWDALVAYGPIESSVWRVVVPGVLADVTIEQWSLPTGPPIVELSARTSAGSAERTLEALGAYAQARGLGARPADTKSKQALDRLAPQ